MTIDLTQPVITETLSERLENVGLHYDWVTASEVNDLSGHKINRRFSQVEFQTPLELSVVAGRPEGHPTLYSYHFETRSQFYNHTYSGQDFLADEPPNDVFNHFWGWRYEVELWERVNTWTDDLMQVVVWQLKSRPSASGLAMDDVRIYDGKGNLVSSTPLSESDAVSGLAIAAGQTWGMRTRASQTGFRVQVLNGTTVVLEQIPTDLYSVGPTPVLTAPTGSGLEAIAPLLIQYPTLKVLSPLVGDRPYIEVPEPTPTPTGSGSGGAPVLVPSIQVIAEVQVYLYGQYWDESISQVQIYEQGWLVHPPGTSDSDRLKPPGLSSLSDVYTSVPRPFSPNAASR